MGQMARKESWTQKCKSIFFLQYFALKQIRKHKNKMVISILSTKYEDLNAWYSLCQKSICNPWNTDLSKFRSELEDKLSYYNGFRVETRMTWMTVMLNTSMRYSYISSWPHKIIQDKSLWWTKELNKLRKNTRRKLSAVLRQNVPEHWES